MSEELRIKVNYHSPGKGIVSIDEVCELAEEIQSMEASIQQLNADKRELVEALDEIRTYGWRDVPRHTLNKADELVQRHGGDNAS